MGGLSGGAVRVYLHEEGVTLKDLSAGRRHGWSTASWSASGCSSRSATSRPARCTPTDFLCRLFEQESQGLFDAREVVLGHIQQGGEPDAVRPDPGTRLASHCIDYLSQQITEKKSQAAVIGLNEGKVRTISLRQSEELADWEFRRPTEQWWEELRPIINTLASRLAAEEPVAQGPAFVEEPAAAR